MLGTIFGLMLLLLVLTVPIGVVLLCVSLSPVLIDHSFIASVQYVLRNMVGGLNSTPLIAIPLFILGGILMAKAGLHKSSLMYLPI